jgi:CDP-glycerol glycerophosphotransferase (TagB/SpsB family)
VETTDELVGAVTGMLADGVPRTDRYAAFVARFCPWEDGKASERVWAAVLG